MEPNTNEAVIQPTPPSTPHPIVKSEGKPKKSRSLLIIIVGIVLILLIGGIAGAYFLGKKSSGNNIVKIPTPVTNQNEATSTPIPTTEPELTADQALTVDWKTYTGNGISFKYPSSYILKENENKNTIKNFHLNIYNDPKILDKDSSKYFTIGMEIDNLPKGSDLLTYIKSQEDVTMGGQKGKIFEDKDIKPYSANSIQGYYWFGGFEYMGWHTYFEKDGKVYVFSFNEDEAGNFPEPKKTEPNKLDQILSTFRFE